MPEFYEAGYRFCSISEYMEMRGISQYQLSGKLPNKNGNNGMVTNISEVAREKLPINPGDVNEDNAINNKDLAILIQKINGWKVTLNETVADVNGDSSVNNKDYALLMQSINGWEVELK